MEASASHRPRIAVVGTGVSGLSCAWRLRSQADITLFESEKRPGGHSNTVTVQEDGREIPIDTGFIVFNKVTYPNLCQLFGELGIAVKPSEMSFSVQHTARDLEYNGMGLNKLFAQRRNIGNLRFLALIAEIMRFFRVGRRWLRDEEENNSSEEGVDLAEEDLATFCKRHHFGPDFLELYLVPMSSAVWSTEPGRILEFPASTLLHFFHNHGFLGITTHHPWFTVDGGARTYVAKILAELGAPRLGDPVVSIEETAEGAWVSTASGARELFDAVVIASHADQSLRMLKDPTPEQQRLLSAFHYQHNDASLHTDDSVMPKRRRAWASWNFRVEEQQDGHRKAATHYWMNALQGVSKKQNYFVSLNSTDRIDPQSVLYSTTYEHPIFTLEAIRAQRELPSLNRAGRIFFCGSYFRYGFHEDACMAGFDAATAVTTFLARRR
ncbi:MAG: FAD-dependent oxidoreductase [bacterium]